MEGSSPPGKTEFVALRFTKRDLEEIDRRAAEHHMNRTQYLTQVGLGRLGASESDLMLALERVSTRVKRLEDFAFGGE